LKNAIFLIPSIFVAEKIDLLDFLFIEKREASVKSSLRVGRVKNFKEHQLSKTFELLALCQINGVSHLHTRLKVL